MWQPFLARLVLVKSFPCASLLASAVRAKQLCTHSLLHMCLMCLQECIGALMLRYPTSLRVGELSCMSIGNLAVCLEDMWLHTLHTWNAPRYD